jgi:hypothetical protein
MKDFRANRMIKEYRSPLCLNHVKMSQLGNLFIIDISQNLFFIQELFIVCFFLSFFLSFSLSLSLSLTVTIFLYIILSISLLQTHKNMLTHTIYCSKLKMVQQTLIRKKYPDIFFILSFD